MFGWKDRISVIIASAVYLQSLQNSSDGEVDRHGWHDRTIFKSRGRSFSVSKWTKGIVSRAKKKQTYLAIMQSSHHQPHARMPNFLSLFQMQTTKIEKKQNKDQNTLKTRRLFCLGENLPHPKKIKKKRRTSCILIADTAYCVPSRSLSRVPCHSRFSAIKTDN